MPLFDGSRLQAGREKVAAAKETVKSSLADGPLKLDGHRVEAAKEKAATAKQSLAEGPLKLDGHRAEAAKEKAAAFKDSVEDRVAAAKEGTAAKAAAAKQSLADGPLKLDGHRVEAAKEKAAGVKQSLADGPLKLDGHRLEAAKEKAAAVKQSLADGPLKLDGHRLEAAKEAAKGVAHAVKDAVDDVRTAVAPRAPVPPEKIAAPTPADRWWTADGGWPELGPAAPGSPPSLLVPAAARRPSPPQLGSLRLEVLQASGLPKPRRAQLGRVDPYVLVLLECHAARTSTVRNDHDPAWPFDTSCRAFALPVSCPYAVAYVAVLDEDAKRDDPLGRVVLELASLRTGTVYEAWYPLECSVLRRASGARGAIRLRYSLTYTEPRARLTAYAAAARPPSFVVPFTDVPTLREAAFAHRGKHGGRAYHPAVIRTHVKELRATAAALARACRAFFFWHSPVASALALALYQAVVSYPLLLLPCLPLAPLVGILRGARRGGGGGGGGASALHGGPSVRDLWRMLLLNRAEAPPPPVEPSAEALEAGGGGGGSEEEEEEGEEEEEEEEVVEEYEQDEGGPLGRLKAVRAERKLLLGQGRKRSLAEELEELQAEVDEALEQEAAGLAPADGGAKDGGAKGGGAKGGGGGGYGARPLARLLGPVQLLLGQTLLCVRVLRRVGAWHDPALSFAVCAGLALAAALLLLLGCALQLALSWLAALLPWGLLGSWFLRLLGVALLGPHMYFVERREAEERAAAETFARLDATARGLALEEHRARLMAEARAQRAEELARSVGRGGRQSSTAADELGPSALVLRALPASAGGLRWPCVPDAARSRAIPLDVWEGEESEKAMAGVRSRNGGYSELYEA